MGKLNLCLSTSLTDCVSLMRRRARNDKTLPQHVPYGLRPEDSFALVRQDVLCLSTSLTDCVGKYAQKHPFFWAKRAVSW